MFKLLTPFLDIRGLNPGYEQTTRFSVVIISIIILHGLLERSAGSNENISYQSKCRYIHSMFSL